MAYLFIPKTSESFVKTCHAAHLSLLRLCVWCKLSSVIMMLGLSAPKHVGRCLLLIFLLAYVLMFAALSHLSSLWMAWRKRQFKFTLLDCVMASQSVLSTWLLKTSKKNTGAWVYHRCVTNTPTISLAMQCVRHFSYCCSGCLLESGPQVLFATDKCASELNKYMEMT